MIFLVHNNVGKFEQKLYARVPLFFCDVQKTVKSNKDKEWWFYDSRVEWDFNIFVQRYMKVHNFSDDKISALSNTNDKYIGGLDIIIRMWIRYVIFR